MSLINQMLQDLDERKVAHGMGSGLPNDVRPLPRPRSSHWPLVVGLLAFALAAGTLAAYWWSVRQGGFLPMTETAPKASTLPMMQTTSPESISATEDTPTRGAPVAKPEEGPAAETSEASHELQALDGSLRMSDALGFATEDPRGTKARVKEARANRPQDKQRVASTVDGIPKSRSEPEQTVPVPALPSSSPVAERPQLPAKIEKTEVPGLPKERAEMDYRKAIAAVNLGRVDEALVDLRNGLRQDRYHPASRQLLVRLLIEAKRLDEAEQALSDGLQGQPAQLGWAMALARLQVDRGDLASAWQTLNYSQPAAGANADYQGFSGHVLQRLGRHKEAIEHFLAAARLSPNDGRWWLGLGLSLEAEGRPSEAKDAFRKAQSSGSLDAELSALVEQKLR